MLGTHPQQQQDAEPEENEDGDQEKPHGHRDRERRRGDKMAAQDAERAARVGSTPMEMLAIRSRSHGAPRRAMWRPSPPAERLTASGNS
jgi:hypothetical protein